MAGTIHKADGTILDLSENNTAAQALITIRKSDVDDDVRTLWSDATYTDAILPPAGSLWDSYVVSSGTIVERAALSKQVRIAHSAWTEFAQRVFRESLGFPSSKRDKIFDRISSSYRGFWAMCTKASSGLSSVTAPQIIGFCAEFPKGPTDASTPLEFCKKSQTDVTGFTAGTGCIWVDRDGARTTWAAGYTHSVSVGIAGLSEATYEAVDVVGGAWIDNLTA